MDDASLHRRFMEEALAEADEAARRGEVPVGALVVKEGHVVSRGYNLRESWRDPTAHAELIAIRRAAARLGGWRLEGCTVYVTLEPCAMCAGAMVLARVHRCVYGCADPKGGFVGSLGDLSTWAGTNHRFDVVSGVEAEASARRLRDFFRTLRNEPERWPSG